MNDAYSSLARCYDKLNSGVDYAAVADFVERCFVRYGNGAPESVLDLACGTGSLTVELARRGYDMIGVDLSEDMLAEARQKCDAKRFAHSVLLVRQSMQELELYGTVGATVCMLDSLNYLTEPGELERTFAHVANYLDENGLFVFDMNAPAKFERVYADNAYVLEDEGLLCAWQNEYNEKRKICSFYLSIFRECEDGRWERAEEYQRERCYALRTVKKLLKETSFDLLEVASGLNGEPVTADTERWYFVARKAKRN